MFKKPILSFFIALKEFHHWEAWWWFLWCELIVQTLGNDCLFVEGASGVEPSSVAKVLEPAFASYLMIWLLFTAPKYHQMIALKDYIYWY